MGKPDVVHMRPAHGPCEVCNWPTKGLAARLVRAMKDSHPRGINACRKCIARARQDAINKLR